MGVKARNYLPGENEEEVRAFLGALATGDWIQALIARGYGYHMDIGAFSTPITGGGAGTIIDQDQPEGIVSVPAGHILVPLRVDVQCQPPLNVADSEEQEILLAADRAAAWANDGTVTRETAYNMRTNVAGSGPLNCASAATANITNPTLDIELAREVYAVDLQGTAANMLKTKLRLLYEPKHPPFIVGPAALYLYWGGTVAMAGFAQLDMLAFPANLITQLA